MPIYEYACQKCQHKLDALQKISDDPLLECPECGEPALRRLISAPRFRLKGQGWYETDFKKDNQRNLVKSDNDAVKADAKSDKKDSATPEKKSKAESPAKAESAPKATSKKDD